MADRLLTCDSSSRRCHRGLNFFFFPPSRTLLLAFPTATLTPACLSSSLPDSHISSNPAQIGAGWLAGCGTILGWWWGWHAVESSRRQKEVPSPRIHLLESASDFFFFPVCVHPSPGYDEGERGEEIFWGGRKRCVSIALSASFFKIIILVTCLQLFSRRLWLNSTCKRTRQEPMRQSPPLLFYNV